VKQTVQTRVFILIPNWNGLEHLPKCLESLSAQTVTDFVIIIVDNGSTDGSVEYLREHWPDVKVIELRENRGFAVANNIGAREAKGNWIALLNNDAFPEPDWLENLVEATQKYSEYTVFGSKLIQANNPNLLDGTGDIYHISGLAWRRDYNYPVEDSANSVEEIFSPCAAAALYSRNAFLDVGGFDEDFTSYHEDVDLGFRLRLKGHCCLYVPEAIVKHVGSASLGKQSDSQIYYGHRNLVWSYFQNMPDYLFWIYLPSHLLANLIFMIYYSIRGQAQAIFRAKLDALRGLPKALAKRREIQKTRKVKPSEVSRMMEHGWLKPYLLGFRARQKLR